MTVRDKHGRRLRVGDEVYIKATVVTLYGEERIDVRLHSGDLGGCPTLMDPRETERCAAEPAPA